MNQIQDADVILFGELHDNPISHWVELQIAKELEKRKGKGLIIGAEMLELDDQLVVDEYLGGLTEFNHVENEISGWPNFKTDYKPLLDFAKENEVSFLATNIPRRYAALVARKGQEVLDTLSEQAKQYIPPLPIEYDAEAAGYAALMGHGHGHHLPHLAEAQAIKDATMAHVILENVKTGKTFFHIHGAFHSLNFQGIYYFLKRQKPDLKVVVVSTAEQKDISKLADENKGKADFFVLVPEDMTKTY